MGYLTQFLKVVLRKKDSRTIMPRKSMASLEKVGTRLGDKPNRRTGAVSMLDIVEHFHQNPGFSSENQLPNHWNDKHKQVLSNAFHHGYILRDVYCGTMYFGIPDKPSDEVKSLQSQFIALANDKNAKDQLIESLIAEQIASPNNPQTNNNNAGTSTSNISNSQQNPDAKIVLENTIKQREQELQNLQGDFDKEQKILKDLEDKIDRQTQVLSDLKSILGKL